MASGAWHALDKNSKHSFGGHFAPRGNNDYSGPRRTRSNRQTRRHPGPLRVRNSSWHHRSRRLVTRRGGLGDAAPTALVGCRSRGGVYGNEAIWSEVPTVIGRKSKASTLACGESAVPDNAKAFLWMTRKIQPPADVQRSRSRQFCLNLIFLEQGNRVLNGNHDRKPGILSRRGNHCLESLRRENR